METYGLDSRFGKALYAEITVNGVLAATVTPGHPSFQSLPIHHDVLPGANRIEVIATVPAPPGSPAPVGDAETMYIELSLEADDVRDLGDRYEVTTFAVKEEEWRAPTGAPLTLPHRIAIDWHAPAGVTTPVWARASAVGVEHARSLIAAELEELGRLLADRRLDGFQARMRIRNEDMARAYPINGSAAQRARADSESLDQVLPAAPVLAAIDPARLRLRAFAGGRVFQCQMDDGQPALRCIVPGEEPIYFSSTFAMVDGRMAVIR